MHRMHRVTLLDLFILFALVFSTSASAQPKTKRDVFTKISDIKCEGGGHKVWLHWDSAVTWGGPHSVALDGKNVKKLKYSYQDKIATYEAEGFTLSLNDSDKKKNFKKDVTVRGRKVGMDCTYSWGFKLFRKRELTEDAAYVGMEEGVSDDEEDEVDAAH
jgi:hypothetical protein